MNWNSSKYNIAKLPMNQVLLIKRVQDKKCVDEKILKDVYVRYLLCNLIHVDD